VLLTHQRKNGTARSPSVTSLLQHEEQPAADEDEEEDEDETENEPEGRKRAPRNSSAAATSGPSPSQIGFYEDTNWKRCIERARSLNRLSLFIDQGFPTRKQADAAAAGFIGESMEELRTQDILLERGTHFFLTWSIS
jgi:hypothetical protein